MGGVSTGSATAGDADRPEYAPQLENLATLEEYHKQVVYKQAFFIWLGYFWWFNLVAFGFMAS